MKTNTQQAGVPAFISPNQFDRPDYYPLTHMWREDCELCFNGYVFTSSRERDEFVTANRHLRGTFFTVPAKIMTAELEQRSGVKAELVSSREH